MIFSQILTILMQVCLFNKRLLFNLEYLAQLEQLIASMGARWVILIMRQHIIESADNTYWYGMITFVDIKLFTDLEFWHYNLASVLMICVNTSCISKYYLIIITWLFFKILTILMQVSFFNKRLLISLPYLATLEQLIARMGAKWVIWIIWHHTIGTADNTYWYGMLTFVDINFCGI